MSDYILSCCSTADLSQEHFDKIGVHYVCFHFNMDGKEYPDDLGKSMPFAEFYKRIADGAEPTRRYAISYAVFCLKKKRATSA